MNINGSSPQLSLVQKSAKIVLGLFMLFAGISHLTFARAEFLAQVPPWFPMNPDLVVVLSGVVEIIFGLLMILKYKDSAIVGLFLAAFFVAIFPGNISQYQNGIDAFGLNTDQARFTRLFFQPVLILWALWSTGALTYLRALRKHS